MWKRSRINNLPIQKIWEFNEEEGLVVIYHHGFHDCIPKLNDPAPNNNERLKEKLSKRNATPQQAVNETNYS